MSKLDKEFEVVITKMHHTGEGVGRYKNRSIFVFGTMIGERVLVRPIKVSRGKAKAQVLRVLEASVDRQKEKEDHYLSCSPWQIINYPKQLEYKVELVKKLFSNEAGLMLEGKDAIVGSKIEWQYRNKMEFSFVKKVDEKLSLAFHVRGRRYDCYELDECVLASEKINKVAAAVMTVLNERQIALESLKNLVLRYSQAEDKCLAVLYVKTEDFAVFDLNIDGVAGWQIIYSDPQSPATVITKILHQQGRDYLEEKIDFLKLRFRHSNFFQINPPLFGELMNFVKDNVKNGGDLIDLYAGVGTVGFFLTKQFKNIISVELDDAAVKIAQDNIALNNLENITLHSGASEKQDLNGIFSLAKTLVVDPPRSGLHPKVTKAILKSNLKQFIYISCNPLTQAKDMRLLKQKYKVKKWRLFDLYPQTPHVESVLILRRKIFGLF